MLPTKLFQRILIICLLPLLASVSAGADADLEELFTKANDKVLSGDMTGAIDAYNRILKVKPRSDNVWLMRAVAKWQLKDALGAAADVAMAIELNPKHPDSYRLRATLRFEEKEYDGALLDINKSIELDPKFAKSYEIRAKILYAQDGADAALPDLNEAIRLNPQLVEATFLRAQAHKEMGNDASALSDYDQVIALAPDMPAAYYDRAWVKFSLTDWAGTIEDGKKHIALTGPTVDTLRVIGLAQFGQGDYAAAIKTLTQAADLKGADEELVAYALFFRQLALLRAGETDDRLARSLAGWKETSWYRTIGRFLAGQLTEEGFDDAAGPLEVDEESRGHHCESNFYIGMMRLKAGDRSAARLRFEAAVAAARPQFIEHTFAQEELKKFKKR